LQLEGYVSAKTNPTANTTQYIHHVKQRVASIQASWRAP
jgi:hypothetical protein